MEGSKLVVFVVTRHEYYLSFIAILPGWCNDNSISRYPVHWLLGRIREGRKMTGTASANNIGVN